MKPLESSPVYPIHNQPGDFDRLFEAIDDASVVLIGEASHGTQEFYATRAALTRRLIETHGFCAVMVEADWPDTYRVDQYIQGASGDTDAASALGNFARFPRWMWRNHVVAEFVEWLRQYNTNQPQGRTQVSFLGLDLYSLYNSIEAVIAYLQEVDPEAAQQARHTYSCLEDFGRDPQIYGYMTAQYESHSCQQEIVEQLQELRSQREHYIHHSSQQAYFNAEQNARLVKNAEAYYRTMYQGRVSSWNLRDQHMFETMQGFMDFLSAQGEQPKVVVWAHNSHLGDARATEMGGRGELNLGQLVRQHYGEDCFGIGFSTYSGTVTAANNWDEPGQCMHVRPGFKGSYENLFHDMAGQMNHPDFYVLTAEQTELLPDERPQRAIGVIYRPETERLSHYFSAKLIDQFDALIHLDRTSALRPLDPMPECE